MSIVQVKDPSSVLDFQHDWDDAYLVAGETIAASSWAVTPAGTLTIDSHTETTTTTTVFLSAGTVGEVYDVTNTVTTNAARTEERTIVVRVEQQ